MDSAAPGFSERASPDRGLVGAKPAQSGETAYLREDATRPAARKGARAANELEGGDSMGAATEPTTSGLAEPKATGGKKDRTSRRRRRIKTAEPSMARYFLIKASGSDGLQLGEEVASENEALTASFRASGSYAVVTEWKADVDVSTGAPVIKKEGVQREKK